MSLKKYFRRNVYKWHRVTSLLVAIPVLMWTVSGFLHPVVGSFKPDVKNNHLPASVIDSAYITIPLQVALLQNGIDSFQNFRIVKLYRGYYYQVWQEGVDSLTYLNCESGNLLINGDKHYASYLAQRCLWEENDSQNSGEHDHGKMTASISGGTTVQVSKKRSANQKVKIISTTLITSFSKDYKASNKILPVYEVAFDREDGIRLYIETKADGLALSTDNKKRWFANFFAFAHSWSFLNSMGKLKSVLLGTFSALCLLSCIFGFAVYNLLHTNKKTIAKSKWLHRILGNVFLITTLLYAFSGAWHAFAKMPAKTLPTPIVKSNIAANDLRLGRKTISSFLSPKEKLTNISVVKMDGESYWQVSYKKGKEVFKKYFNSRNNTLLSNGDKKYSIFLASLSQNLQRNAIVSVKEITAFHLSYSMMNKRLPVMENKLGCGKSIYIETATGTVASVTRPSDKAERFSFSNLHMHQFWERWAGKENGKAVKNAVLISTTLGLLLLAITGLMVYLRKKFMAR